MRKKRRLYLRKYKREWRNIRYIKGICQECSNPVFKDKTRCFIHLQMRSMSQKKYRTRRHCVEAGQAHS